MKENSLLSIDRYGVKLQLVEADDAEFIVSLRIDEKLNRYISRTSSNVEEQKQWIRNYKIREREKKEYYFICKDVEGRRLGTTRIYNFVDTTFELGSWVFKLEVGSSAIIADIVTKEFAFDTLGFAYCVFNVRKDNKSVLNYHKKYRPEIIYETEFDIGFRLHKDAFAACKEKFLKILLR